jgi:hypothetical protein
MRRRDSAPTASAASLGDAASTIPGGPHALPVGGPHDTTGAGCISRSLPAPFTWLPCWWRSPFVGRVAEARPAAWVTVAATRGAATAAAAQTPAAARAPPSRRPTRAVAARWTRNASTPWAASATAPMATGPAWAAPALRPTAPPRCPRCSRHVPKGNRAPTEAPPPAAPICKPATAIPASAPGSARDRAAAGAAPDRATRPATEPRFLVALPPARDLYLAA